MIRSGSWIHSFSNSLAIPYLASAVLDTRIRETQVLFSGRVQPGGDSIRQIVVSVCGRDGWGSQCTAAMASFSLRVVRGGGPLRTPSSRDLSKERPNVSYQRWSLPGVRNSVSTLETWGWEVAKASSPQPLWSPAHIDGFPCNRLDYFMSGTHWKVLNSEKTWCDQCLRTLASSCQLGSGKPDRLTTPLEIKSQIIYRITSMW